MQLILLSFLVFFSVHHFCPGRACVRVSNYVDILVVGGAVIYICTLLFSFRFRLTLSQFIYFGARVLHFAMRTSMCNNFVLPATLGPFFLFLIYANKWKISQKKLLDVNLVWLRILVSDSDSVSLLDETEDEDADAGEDTDAEYLNALMRFNWNFRFSAVWKIKIISGHALQQCCQASGATSGRIVVITEGMAFSVPFNSPNDIKSTAINWALVKKQRWPFKSNFHNLPL